MYFRSTLLFFGVSVFLLFAMPAPAHADGWLEFFFPTLKEQGPDPSETMQAPFANPDAVIDEPNPSEGLQDTATPLHMRHRINSAITKWVEDTVPELMSYNTADFQQTYKQKRKKLSETGNKEYVAFLKDKNFLTTLNSGKYDVRAFVTDLPEMKKEGAVGGRYRWLYRVEVMVSYVPSGLRDYKLANDKETITQEMVIFLQVGRHNNVDNEHGILVETWSGKIVR
jgi:hypothetical protein